MRDINVRFGMSAGKIWKTLNENGEMDKEKLLELTRLNDDDFNAALGWLARENKIALDNNCLKLDVTNLEGEIGNHAGMIWRILDVWGDADIATIKRLSHLNDEQIYSALGWLAREDKIYFNEKNKKYSLK